ncbi:NADH:flavin oxidoreductase/NADH oxidase [haloarchaeon 3A1-DGR]|nr:NADH:flavin oxidoreductase/NADH oxidase [haloarchaeon 3A1-DGR]
MTPTLFSPVSIRGTDLRNRVMVSPMCQYCAADGLADDWHRVHLGTRAVGGAGLVMTEATAVEPRGRITPFDLGIWSDEHADALAPIASFVREQGAVPGIQLAHAGRKASHAPPREGREPIRPPDGGWETVSASGVPYPEENAVPTRRLSEAGIEAVVDAFGAAARRAREAGFEVVEIHAAHGYLLHQFLSPVTNRRDDRYGGDLESRARVPTAVVERVREVWPDDAPVFVRISATDWLPDRTAWTVDDAVELAGLLAAAGADLVDVSGGGIHPDQRIPETGPGYQVPYAETVREAGALPVATVGKITSPTHADAIVRNGRADLVALGRELLRNPYWPLAAARELGADVEWPTQYVRAKPR